VIFTSRQVGVGFWLSLEFPNAFNIADLPNLHSFHLKASDNVGCNANEIPDVHVSVVIVSLLKEGLDLETQRPVLL